MLLPHHTVELCCMTAYHLSIAIINMPINEWWARLDSNQRRRDYEPLVDWYWSEVGRFDRRRETPRTADVAVSALYKKIELPSRAIRR